MDAGPNFGAPLASLATADTVAQAVIGLTLGADVRSDVDLGLSFEAVTNTRPSGQGSLAAFIDNANRIQGPNTARFVIPGVADPVEVAVGLAGVGEGRAVVQAAGERAAHAGGGARRCARGRRLRQLPWHIHATQ